MSAAPLFSGRERRFLQPGHLVVSAAPLTVTTILGSCVSVCLFDAQKGIGGMNHFMLPDIPGSSAASPRFGPTAMDELVRQLRNAGGRLPFLQARVFGGACMFEHALAEDHLGAKNAEIALDDLFRRAIEVIQIEVGGDRGRKVTFETETGAACLSMI